MIKYKKTLPEAWTRSAFKLIPSRIPSKKLFQKGAEI